METLLTNGGMFVAVVAGILFFCVGAFWTTEHNCRYLTCPHAKERE